MREYRGTLWIVLFVSMTVTIVSFYNHTLFHFIVVLLTIFSGISIYIMASNSKIYSKKDILLAIGTAYLYVGVLDFLHLLHYGDIGIIETTEGLSRGFWMSARFLEAANIAVIFFLFRRPYKYKHHLSHLMHMLYLGTAFAMFFFKINPEELATNYTKILNAGLNTTSIIMLLVGISLVTKTTLSKQHKNIIIVSITMKVLSVLIFGLFNESSETLVNVSDILRLLSYMGFYLVFIRDTLVKPYQNVYGYFKKRQDELIHLTEIDPMTGLLNHSATYASIEMLVEKYKDTNEKMFVTMIDVDDFKIINDKYGHQVGDQVLIRFAGIISQLGFYDGIYGRYGGDEFVVAGVFKDEISPQNRFKELRRRVDEEFKDLDVDFTISAGNVLYTKGDTAKDLIYKADIKMYESKRLGKNQVSQWKRDE